LCGGVRPRSLEAAGFDGIYDGTLPSYRRSIAQGNTVMPLTDTRIRNAKPMAKGLPIQQFEFKPKIDYTHSCGVGYIDAALNQDIERLREHWEKVQASRARDAIYGYLRAAYELVLCWKVECQEIQRARRALKINGLAPPVEPEPFGAVVAASVSPKKLDRRQLSKYSRVLRYAAARECHPKRLKGFIERHGGLNGAAAKFKRRLGR
jgi:hypothetical protein